MLISLNRLLLATDISYSRQNYSMALKIPIDIKIIYMSDTDVTSDLSIFGTSFSYT